MIQSDEVSVTPLEMSLPKQSLWDWPGDTVIFLDLRSGHHSFPSPESDEQDFQT